ncbi:hypothetical protein HPB47_011851 [Ixodes persulcatus]|uniref:Uncharacterized protein n=1 Tax=Ixodes persulcatus TaxID=34615 RepID=A0AC60NVG6_IXOPE|nr:hypothetical protein HPB47_011851 [Ixodes persulcatus]
MEVFTVEMQSVLTGLTLNAAVLFMAYFVASHRCCHGPDSALASAHVATLLYAKCFAAGIFLETLFVEFMPTARASVELALKSSRIHAAFPVAETLVLVGFCAALCVEQILFPPGESEKVARPAKDCSANLLQGSDVDLATRLLENSSPSKLVVACREDVASLPFRPRTLHRLSMLVGCTGVHFLLEGLALGLQANLTTTIRLAVGVYVHGALVLIAVGLRLGGSGLPVCTVAKMGLALASAAPFGQMLGMAFGTEIGHVGKAAVHALTTGTFFHVLFVEILPVEMGSLENRQPKVTSLIAGFALATATSFASNRTLAKNVRGWTIPRPKLRQVYAPLGFTVDHFRNYALVAACGHYKSGLA